MTKEARINNGVMTLQQVMLGKLDEYMPKKKKKNRWRGGGVECMSPGGMVAGTRGRADAAVGS